MTKWCVSDPFALKRNVARSLNSQMVFEYIQERFRTAYKYFACPQSRNGANGSRGVLSKKPRRFRAARFRNLDRKNQVEVEKSGEEDGDSSDDEDERDMEEEESLRAGFNELLVDAGCESVSREISTAVSLSTVNGLLMDSEEEEEEVDKDLEMEQHDSIAPEDMHYIFDRMIFTGGKVSTGHCNICGALLCKTLYFKQSCQVCCFTVELGYLYTIATGLLLDSAG